MKILSSLFLYMSATCLAQVTPAEPDSQTLAAQARGLAALARELAADSTAADARCFATVLSASTEPAADLADRPLPHLRGGAVVEVAMRTTFELQGAGYGLPVTHGKRSVVEWKRDQAARIRNSPFGRNYADKRAVVLGGIFSPGGLISFREEGAEPLASVLALPPRSLDAVRQAARWRTAAQALFSPDAAADENTLPKLRAAARDTSPCQRLVALLRLSDLKQLTAQDIHAALLAATSVEETAATVLTVLRAAPVLTPALGAAVDTAALDSVLMQGIALGATVHFMDLPDIDHLLRETLWNEFEPSPPASPKLAETVSYPLLQHLSRKVSAAVVAGHPLPPGSLLQRLLAAAGL